MQLIQIFLFFPQTLHVLSLLSNLFEQLEKFLRDQFQIGFNLYFIKPPEFNPEFLVLNSLWSDSHVESPFNEKVNNLVKTYSSAWFFTSQDVSR